MTISGVRVCMCMCVCVGVYTRVYLTHFMSRAPGNQGVTRARFVNASRALRSYAVIPTPVVHDAIRFFNTRGDTQLFKCPALCFSGKLRLFRSIIKNHTRYNDEPLRIM